MCSNILTSEFKPLDLLIRDKQVGVITEDLISTGNWVEVPLVRAFGEDYLEPRPRVFERTDGSFSIKIWSEEAAHLLVDPPADDRIDIDGTLRPLLIQAPCCEALNSVLLESVMHPNPETGVHNPRLLTSPNIRFLPHTLCQSTTRQPQTKVYIPTISRYLDALLAQIRWLEKSGYASIAYGPRADVAFLVRYLFLEIPSQRGKLFPLLRSELRCELEKILDGYKRTHKLKVGSEGVIIAHETSGNTQTLKQENGGEEQNCWTSWNHMDH